MRPLRKTRRLPSVSQSGTSVRPSELTSGCESEEWKTAPRAAHTRVHSSVLAVPTRTEQPGSLHAQGAARQDPPGQRSSSLGKEGNVDMDTDTDTRRDPACTVLGDTGQTATDLWGPGGAGPQGRR